MKWILIAIIVATVGLAVKNKYLPAQKQQDKKISQKLFVLLELFTSEGCSSCPSADNLLPVLIAKDSNIIALSFHVDYWDNLGWKDAFSNPAYTSRQKNYGEHFHLESIYTPQLIINGEYEIVGSNKSGAENFINKALAEESSTEIIFDDVKKEGKQLSVSCHLTGNIKDLNLLAAVLQKHAERNIKGGENSGSKLSHTNVVRSFIQKPAVAKINFTIELPTDLKDGEWSFVVYTQKKSDLKITGAALYK